MSANNDEIVTIPKSTNDDEIVTIPKPTNDDEKELFVRKAMKIMLSEYDKYESVKVNFEKVKEYICNNVLIENGSKQVCSRYQLQINELILSINTFMDDAITIAKIDSAINNTFNKSMTINLSNLDEYSFQAITTFYDNHVSKMQMLVDSYVKMVAYHYDILMKMLKPDDFKLF